MGSLRGLFSLREYSKESCFEQIRIFPPPKGPTMSRGQRQPLALTLTGEKGSFQSSTPILTASPLLSCPGSKPGQLIKWAHWKKQCTPSETPLALSSRSRPTSQRNPTRFPPRPTVCSQILWVPRYGHRGFCGDQTCRGAGRAKRLVISEGRGNAVSLRTHRLRILQLSTWELWQFLFSRPLTCIFCATSFLSLSRRFPFRT